MFHKSIIPAGHVKRNRVYEFQLYPNKKQAETIREWMRTCCWVFNKSLEHRVKTYKRRKETVNLVTQTGLLTKWRARIPRLKSVPVEFTRDALRRVDRAFQNFFCRVEQKAKKPGFPRFKPWQRYTSLEIQVTRKYLKVNRIFVPKLGLIRARGQFDFEGTQKALRVLYKAGKFYAQIVTEQIVLTPTQQPLTPVCGIDLGLTSFLTLDTGEKVPNPRLLRKTASKLRHLNKELARRSLKSSHRRAKTKLKLTATYDRLQRQRRGFHHRVSHGLVSRFNTICVEDLNVKGLVRTRLAKHVHDVAWAQFVRFLTYKAESAGKRVVLVDPRGTSQTCPRCGFVKPKKLSERQHDCGRCDLRLDRDHAAAIVVRNRGVSRGRGDLVSPAPSRVG